jgi:hypothetical protein
MEHPKAKVFSEHVGTTFYASAFGADPVPLELREVSEMNPSPALEQFSVTYQGPLIPQSTFKLTNDKLGCMDIFLVPIERNDDGIKYQAVFNRLKNRWQQRRNAIARIVRCEGVSGRVVPLLRNAALSASMNGVGWQRVPPSLPFTCSCLFAQIVYPLAASTRRNSCASMRYLNAFRPSMNTTGTSSLY